MKTLVKLVEKKFSCKAKEVIQLHEDDGKYECLGTLYLAPLIAVHVHMDCIANEIEFISTIKLN